MLGFLLDWCLGDPYDLPHPIRWIGSAVGALERKWNRETDAPSAQRKKGALLVICMLIVSVGASAGILWLAYRIHWLFGILAESILCYYMLAAQCLKRESMKVYTALQNGDVEGARYAVSMIVGRDTACLDQAGITRAAVETVAENTSDGVIAPLFYMLLGGAAGGFFYKTVNTMDSMLGYHNERFEHFGFAAAKLDDIVNYIPARISALFMTAAAFLCGYDHKNAWRIFKRDRYQHKSPNSAQTESVCAGALGLRLAGDASYFGKRVEKPYIGDAVREIEPEDIKRANRLMYVTAILWWLAVIIIRLWASAA